MKVKTDSVKSDNSGFICSLVINTGTSTQSLHNLKESKVYKFFGEEKW